MTSIRTAYALFPIMIFALFSACAPVQTVNVWKDQAYQKKPRKILVIGVGERKFMRNFFENNLVQRLKGQGTDAVAANKVFPESDKALDRPTIVAKVKEIGADAVLVARVVSKREESMMIEGSTYIVPTGFYEGWYPFYYDSVAIVSTSGYAYDADIYSMVSNLYDVQTEKLSWSFLSNVRVEGAKERGIEQYMDKLMIQLKGSNIL